MGVETSKSMVWKCERNANQQMSELEPEQGAKARGTASHFSLQTLSKDPACTIQLPSPSL